MAVLEIKDSNNYWKRAADIPWHPYFVTLSFGGISLPSLNLPWGFWFFQNGRFGNQVPQQILEEGRRHPYCAAFSFGAISLRSLNSPWRFLISKTPILGLQHAIPYLKLITCVSALVLPPFPDASLLSVRDWTIGVPRDQCLQAQLVVRRGWSAAQFISPLHSWWNLHREYEQSHLQQKSRGGMGGSFMCFCIRFHRYLVAW